MYILVRDKSLRISEMVIQYALKTGLELEKSNRIHGVSSTFKPGVLNRASELDCKPSGSTLVSKTSKTEVFSAAAFFLSNQKLASTLDFLFFASSYVISADTTRLGNVKSTPLKQFFQY